MSGPTSRAAEMLILLGSGLACGVALGAVALWGVFGLGVVLVACLVALGIERAVRR